MTEETTRWDINKAVEEAEKIGIPMTRPTVIRICREQDAGYQVTGPHGNWVVYPAKFMAIISGNL